MNKLQEAVSRMGTFQGTEGDAVLLQTLARGSALFCKNMRQFQERWEKGDYTEEEQRHVARLTKTYVEFHEALDGGGQDPLLWLGVLALGKFTRSSDVFLKPAGFEMAMVNGGSDHGLWPPGAERCGYCGCHMAPVEDGTGIPPGARTATSEAY